MAIRVPSATRMKSYRIESKFSGVKSKLIEILLPYRKTMYDNSPDRFLDHIRQHTQSGRDRLIVDGSPCRSVDIHICICAGHPVDMWSVDRVLHVGSIEVNEFLGGSRETQYAP